MKTLKTIQLDKTVIDIPFEQDGKVVLTLHFDRSDENVKKFHDLQEKLQKKIDELNEKEATIEETTEVIKEIADGILGEGAFDAMYKLNPSTMIVAKYLYLIAIGIKEELEAEDFKAVEDKYLS